MRNFPLLCFLLTSLAGIGIFSCKKDEPDPNKDNRLFICKINGVEWEPDTEPCYLCPFLPELFAATFGKRRFDLEARKKFTDNNSNEVYQVFRIDADSIQENNTPKNWHVNYYDFYNGNCGNYKLDTTYANVLKITRFDGIYRGIMKGEFEFRLVSEDIGCTETIMVTEGRFDFKTDL